MKKIISTKGLSSGKFDAPWTNTAIHERIDDKLVYCYKQECRDDIQVVPTFSYELADGQVIAIELSYTIDNPTSQRLECFRDTCEIFYELHGFMIDSNSEYPRVYFRAIDMFDVASLIHALDFLSVSLESIMRAVDADLTEMDAIYSPSDAHIIQEDDEDDEADDDMPVFDDHDVGYSKDGKTLTGCRYTFNDTRYEVPDGVEVIDDYAFLPCRHFVELSIPRSVRAIGDNIFGNGGRIEIRDE
jgi:hypothetical protein